MKSVPLTSGTITAPAREAVAVKPRFPVAGMVLLSVLIGGIHFIPQGLHFLRTRDPRVLLQENVDETFFATLVSRQAGEHPGQPDPYRAADIPGPEISVMAAQPFGPYALAALARLLGIRVTVLFWAGSFVFPVLLAWLVIWIVWLCGLREPVQIWMALCLFFLVLPPPYWLIMAKYLLNIFAGRPNNFVIALPYARRLQPQFVGLFHYLAIAASLYSLQLRSKRSSLAAATVSGLAFGTSFYSYFFSWSLLLAWFVLGGVFVWMWIRDRVQAWLLAFGAGLAVSIPYWIRTLRHFRSLGESAFWARTHLVDPGSIREMAALLVVIAGLALFLRKHPGRPLLWAPLVLSAGAGLGVLQNVVTGISVQPWHYLHYFGRPAMSLGLVALLSVASEHFSVLARRPGAVRLLCCGMIGVALFTSAVLQVDHFRRVSTQNASVWDALPAFEFLKLQSPGGAAVYSPDFGVREAVALYTNDVPAYSPYMWHQQTAAQVPALLARVADIYALEGFTREEFVRTLRSRPEDIFAPYYQRLLEARTQEQMQAIERILLEQFDQTLRSERPAALAGLRYLIWPAGRTLETTRFQRYFICRQVWSDRRFSIFELSGKL